MRETCIRFISEDGDKGKVTLRYHGRMAHQDIGMRLPNASRRPAAHVAVVHEVNSRAAK